MITYDFTSLPERFSSNTIKWKAVQKDQEILPLWIADMDFPIFPEMSEAIEDFSHQMVFGYDSPKTVYTKLSLIGKCKNMVINLIKNHYY